MIDATALKYKNLAEVNGRLTYVLTAEEIDNAQTIEISGLPKIHYDRGFIAGYEKGKAERPQGEWIPQGGGFSWVFKCSCCGWVDGYPLNERHKYCPNCGAEMKGGAE